MLEDVDVSAAVRGEKRAIARVIEAIHPLIMQYCRARLHELAHHGVSADDVVQEICIGVLQALPRYQDQGRPFMAFVYGIAARKVADMYRAASRNRAVLVSEVPERPSAGAGPEQWAVQSEAAEWMNKLLAALPKRQREVLILRVVAGLSAAETAAATSGTAGSIRVTQHRALTNLRALIAAEAA